MKAYTFDKDKNYLFFAPHNWGKTMGIVIPQANGNDDILLFANLTETQEAFLNPFVSYIRGCTLSDSNRKSKVADVLSLAKDYPFSRIIVDDTFDLLDIDDITKLLEISESRNIPVLLTFQSKEQAKALGVNVSAFSCFDLENSDTAGFVENDFGFFYPEYSSKDVTENDLSDPCKPLFVKKKTLPGDVVAIDFDGFLSRVSTYTILSPGLVTELLQDYIIPDVSVKDVPRG